MPQARPPTKNKDKIIDPKGQIVDLYVCVMNLETYAEECQKGNMQMERATSSLCTIDGWDYEKIYYGIYLKVQKAKEEDQETIGHQSSLGGGAERQGYIPENMVAPNEEADNESRDSQQKIMQRFMMGCWVLCHFASFIKLTSIHGSSRVIIFLWLRLYSFRVSK